MLSKSPSSLLPPPSSPLPPVYMEIYGCQMNVNDADIAWAILSEAGYQKTQDAEEVRFVQQISFHVLITAFPYEGRRDSGSDVCDQRQCGEEGLVTTRLLPQP